MTEKKAKGHEYINQSRGFKTKGNSYKHRYVEKQCPECGHDRAYEDIWRTRVAYTCLKRACRHKWFVTLTPEEIQVLRDKEAAAQEAALADKEVAE